MNLKLYEITDNYVSAMRYLRARFDAGEITIEALNDTLEGLAGDVEEKVKNVVAYTRNIELEAKAIELAIEPMQARLKSLKNESEWYKQYVLNNMIASEITEIRTPYFVIKTQDNPEKVVIDNEAGITDDCWRVIPETREPDKTAIKEKLKAGEKLEFAHLERGKRLVIK